MAVYVDQFTTSGWIPAGDTFTYSSADAPSYVITCPGDRSDKYYAGMKLKITDSTVKYFIITKVAYTSSTAITVYGGTDYTLSGGALTAPFFSFARCPAGFPMSPAKWRVTTTDTSSRSQSSPVNGTWYNLGSVSISIPIGVWDVRYSCSLYQLGGLSEVVSMFTTLSTANNTESDTDFTNSTFLDFNVTPEYQITHQKEKLLNLSAKTAYYFNSKVGVASVTTLANANNQQALFIHATCSYL